MCVQLNPAIRHRHVKPLHSNSSKLELNKTQFCSWFSASQLVDKLWGLSQQLLQGPGPKNQHQINSEILPEIENKQVKGQILA